MRFFFFVSFFLIAGGLTSPLSAQSGVDTLFCGDTLKASFSPAPGALPQDSFFVWLGNCNDRIRFDFTTADVPDAADIYYLDMGGNLVSAGSMPYFGGDCVGANHFSDPNQYPVQTALYPQNCLPGFVEIYGKGLPFSDSVRQRQQVPADFKLSSPVAEAARLHLDIPADVIGLLFVVKFNPNQSTILQALWDCTPSCCIEAKGDTACVGDTVYLAADRLAFQYQWTGPNGFFSTEKSPKIAHATQAHSGWYVLRGQYLFGCEGLDSVYVHVQGPTVSISPDSVEICAGTTAQLDAIGAQTYQWDESVPGWDYAIGASAWVTPSETRIYSVVGFDAAGCRDTAYAWVKPGYVSLSVQAEDPTCSGFSDGRLEAFLANGQAPYQSRIIGSNWQQGLILSGLSADSYQIEVKDARGCLAAGRGDLSDPDPVEVLVAATDPACTGSCDGEVLLLPVTGNAPFSYLISGQETDSLSFGYCAGTFPIQVFDANGCQWESAFTIVDPEPFEINLGRNKKVREGDSLTLKVKSKSVIDSLLWPGLCEGDCEASIWLRPDSTMPVIVQAWSSQGCVARDSIWVSVKKKAQCGDGVYVPTAFTPNGDGINERFTVYADPEETDVALVGRLIIYNKWGKVIFDQADFPPGEESLGWNGYGNGKAQPEGAYSWAAVVVREDGLRFTCSGSVILMR